MMRTIAATTRVRTAASAVSRRRLLLALGVAMAMLLPSSVAESKGKPTLQFFYAFDCPHCADAKPYLKKLERKYKNVAFRYYEIKKDRAARKHFIRTVKRLRIKKPVVPLFVCGKAYLAGFEKSKSEKCTRDFVVKCGKSQ